MFIPTNIQSLLFMSSIETVTAGEKGVTKIECVVIEGERLYNIYIGPKIVGTTFDRGVRGILYFKE